MRDYTVPGYVGYGGSALLYCRTAGTGTRMCSTDERNTEERGAIKKNFISVVKGVRSSSSKEKIQRTRRHKKSSCQQQDSTQHVVANNG
jgi:hypothetical protein